MPKTPNHDYNVPNEGAQDWHVPLNANFEQFDTDVEIRDKEANKGDYEPKQGAKFLSTDTGVVYVGDGNNWNATTAQARYLASESDRAASLVFGHPDNSVGSDVEGATISGGGKSGITNEVNDDSGTIGGGDGNTVSGGAGTIGGGTGNDARDIQTTIAGGANNIANGAYSTVSGGNENVADALRSTVGGGNNNTAHEEGSTVGGGEINDASEKFSTVAGGRDNTASGNYAAVGGGQANQANGKFSAVPGGRGGKASHDGTFVWADSFNTSFASTAPDQFLVKAGGGVGLGTNEPLAQLHVVDSVSGTAALGNHVAVIENTADGDSDDVLAVKMNESPPGGGNNYISFKDADGPVGAIEGDGNGGVTTASAGNDYAEWLPRRDPDESMESGDVVGVHAGAVSLETAGADRVMVLSTQPVVTGNDPGPAEEDREGYEKVAFVGQAPVNVRGPVETGDLIVTSGDGDGTARAVAPAVYGPGDGPIVGQAWEATDEVGVSEVTVAVGLETGEALEATVERQADRIDELEAENERKDERIEELEERLGALEERMTSVAGCGTAPTPSDD